MKRQGLSGNNGHQREPSQTISARTLWWMRCALSSHLPPAPLASNPPSTDREQRLPTFVNIFTLTSFLQMKQTHKAWQWPTDQYSPIKCTIVSKIIPHPNSQSPSGNKRDHDFGSLETGSRPLPLADPWGRLLHHNEGLTRACLWVITQTLHY